MFIKPHAWISRQSYIALKFLNAYSQFLYFPNHELLQMIGGTPIWLWLVCTFYFVVRLKVSTHSDGQVSILGICASLKNVFKAGKTDYNELNYESVMVGKARDCKNLNWDYGYNNEKWDG